MKIYIHNSGNIQKSKYWYADGFISNTKVYYEGYIFETEAYSIDKARSNILHQAKQRLFGRDNVCLELKNPAGVKELSDDNPYQPVIEPDIKYCEKCGTRLSDGGYCPTCYAEGDESPCYIEWPDRNK